MPAPGLGKCLDSSYFENSRVSCTLDLMKSELLVWSEQRSSFITTSGIKNEAVSGRTQMFCFSVSILCFQSRGYIAVSQIVHISYLLGHCTFADKGIHMQLASDVWCWECERYGSSAASFKLYTNTTRNFGLLNLKYHISLYPQYNVLHLPAFIIFGQDPIRSTYGQLG